MLCGRRVNRNLLMKVGSARLVWDRGHAITMLYVLCIDFLFGDTPVTIPVKRLFEQTEVLCH